MSIKLKSVLIIIISSVVITSVLTLTIFGFYAYLEWKEKNSDKIYHLALYDLNGQIFNKYIIINLNAKIDKEGIFKNKPIIEGTIKNISNKHIYSLKLKIFFYDQKKSVLHVDNFYPVGSEFESFINLGDVTKNFLLEGDSISFKHQLRNCPPKVYNYLKSKLKFATTEQIKPLELRYKIEGVDVK